MPAIAYASVLVAALGATGLIMNSQSGSELPAALADASPAPALNVVPSAPIVPVATASSGQNLPPSYVLEKRPVSYDAPFSF